MTPLANDPDRDWERLGKADPYFAVLSDERFHRGYMQGASPRVLALNATVKPQAERYEHLYVSMLEAELHRSVAEHRAIVRAIRAGNPPATQSDIETNWRNAAERLATVVAAAGERGRW